MLRNWIRTVSGTRRINIPVHHRATNTFNRGIINLHQKITAGFQRRVNPNFRIVRHTRIAAVVREARVFVFRPNGDRAHFLLYDVALHFVSNGLHFPATVTDRLVIGLYFTFGAGASVALITVFAIIVARVVRNFGFTVSVRFVAIFIVCFYNLCKYEYRGTRRRWYRDTLFRFRS